MAVEAGSRKIVRKLLLRGADRYCQDLGGHTPMEVSVILAKDNEEYLSLVQMFDEGNWLKRCLSMKTPLRPPSHIHKQFVSYVTYFISRLVLSTLFVMQFVDSVGVIVIFYLFSAAELTSLLLSKRNPGYFDKKISVRKADLVDIL